MRIISTSRTRSPIARLHEVAPVVSLSAALLLPHIVPHSVRAHAGEAQNLEAVADAIDAVPYRIGDWVGSDTTIPEAARRLLRPNAILSRQYVNLQTGVAITLVIVHCGDSRDMLGHYPPACYPSNGWVRDSSRAGDELMPGHGEDITISTQDRGVPARVYYFAKSQRWLKEKRIRIFNLFILPGGRLTPDIGDVGLQASWLGASVRGVAQIQLVTNTDLEPTEALDAAEVLLSSVEGIMNSMGVQSEAGHD